MNFYTFLINIISKKHFFLLSFLLIIFVFSFFQASIISEVRAEETASLIQVKIDEQDEEIEKLEKAIKESQKKVSEFAGQSASLKKEIANLNYLNSKLQKVIFEKERDIKKLNKNISEISEDISNNDSEIEKLKNNLRKNIFTVNQVSNTSLFETILSGKAISDVTDDISRIEKVQQIFQNTLKKFFSISKELKTEKKKKEDQNTKLDEEKEELSDKKTLLSQNKKEKDYLLKITKNKEENFKKILSEQKKSKAQFEEELLKLESKLKFVLSDKNKDLGKNAVGTFAWPTPSWPKSSHWITQFFGLTTFRETYYDGKGHNGIDIGVPIGTAVYSVMDGTILDTGDTTKVCKGVQYGRWITVDHGNGLVSMYAHLSLIKVAKGEVVLKGQKIALSGNTGYSTGPHLHFTVYFKKGMEIRTISHSYPGRCYGKLMKVPIASHSAYTNPFDYLPKPEFTNIKSVQFNDSSSYVKELQNMLKYEKVFPTDTSANGYFGVTTEASLQRWKDKYTIIGDGKSFSKSDVKKWKEVY